MRASIRGVQANMRLTTAVLLLVVASTTTLVAADVGHEKSVNAYVESNTKRAFDLHSLLVFGSLNLMNGAVRGRVAVKGTASMENFDVARDLASCSPEEPALTVSGALSARLGFVHNGHIMCGRGSSVHTSVRRACSPKVARYSEDPEVSMYDMEVALIRDLGRNCALKASAEVNLTETVMSFVADNSSYSCYSTFTVQADDLSQLREWRYQGDANRNVVINIIGKRASLTHFKMVGFNAARTLLNFCSTYGRFDILNARLHASVLAPSSRFSFSDSIVNGSMVVSSLRGQVAVLKNVYNPC